MMIRVDGTTVVRSQHWAERAHVYARALLDPPAAAAAVTEALARVGPDLGETADADAVLTALRNAVARRMSRPDNGAPPRVLDRLPVLLAARADSRLLPDDAERLARHLDSCSACATMERRITSAESAFLDVHLAAERAPTVSRPRARRRLPRPRFALPAAFVAVGAAVAAIGALDSSPGEPSGREAALTISAPPAPLPARTAPSGPRVEQRRPPRRRAQHRAPQRHSARRDAPTAVARRPTPRPVVAAPTPVTPTPIQRPPKRIPRPTPAPRETAPSDEPLPSTPASAPGRQPPTPE